MKLNYVGFAVLMTVVVVAAACFGYLRTCNQNWSDAGAGLVWQLVPTSGKATYDSELAHSRREILTKSIGLMAWCLVMRRTLSRTGRQFRLRKLSAAMDVTHKALRVG